MPADFPTHIRDQTWTCHVCGEERPDVFISVMRRPLANPPSPGSQANIRYCNDRPACEAEARTMPKFGATQLAEGVL